MLGYVSEQELAWLYTNCLANLYPSWYEGFGLPVLEGMSFGACTIASNKTSMPEIIHKAGILLSPDDTEAWIKTLENATSKPKEMGELRKQALERSAELEWAKSTDNIMRLYSQEQINN